MSLPSGAAAVSRGRPARIRARLARSSFVAIVLAACLSLVVYMGAAAKDIAVAFYFGRSDGLDAFVLALTVFVFLVNNIGTSFAAAVVPVFIDEREHRGGAAGRHVLANVMFLNGACLLVAGALAGLCAPVLLSFIAGSFTPEKRDLTTHLMLLLVPALLVTGVTSIWGPALNAHGRFAVPAITPIFGSIATLLFLLLFGSGLGPQVLAFGVLAGTLIELCALGIYMRHLGLLFFPHWTGFDAPTRSVMRQIGPLAMAGCVSMGAVVVDQAMAATLGTGAVSALNYGTKVATVPLGLASVGITSVLFPQFAQLSVAGDRAGLRRLFLTYLGLAIAASMIACAVIVVYSEQIIGAVFQHGVFSQSDTELVSAVQRLFAFQLPFHVGGLIAARLLSALRLNHVLVMIGSFSLVADVVLDWVLMQFFGLPGIALATTVVFIGTFTLLMVAVNRALRLVRSA